MRIKMFMVLVWVAVFAPLAHATDLTIAISTTAAEDTGLMKLYTTACNDRVQAVPPLAALGGCTTSGSPVVCSCSPSIPQIQTVLGVYLKQQLFNSYSNMLDVQAKKVGQTFPVLTPQQQTTICTNCPGCCD